MKNVIYIDISISIQDCETTSHWIKDKGERERERVFGNIGPFSEREREKEREISE